MESFYRIAADVALTLHFAYVAFVVGGLLLILAGAARGWGWVRNLWFRGLHLAAILVVAAEAWLDLVCPLTTLENWLRSQAGDATHRAAFIADFVHDALFFDLPPWAFTATYTLFALAVLATFYIAPPRRRPRPSGRG
ncbi:MAG: DUF2784 domain-containing protein [Planctomycetales bacterium]